MLTRRTFGLAAAALALGSGAAPAAEPIKVTATFSILADIVRQVGGARVAVTALVGPNGDAHVYQPTPADAKTLAASRLLVMNGLGFEGWMSRLEASSGFKGLGVTAAAGVKAQTMEEEGPGHGHHHGHGKAVVTDPHAWQSLANGKLYARNIRDALIKVDPDGRADYEANAARFTEAADALEAEVRAMVAKIPPGQRRIITSHDAFGYFGTAYGFDFVAPEGFSTESAPSAKDVARIIRQIKAEKIPAVFIENITDKRLLDQITRESGAKIGGTLYSDALSPADGPAATYLDMFRHNLRTIAAALTPAS